MDVRVGERERTGQKSEHFVRVVEGFFFGFEVQEEEDGQSEEDESDGDEEVDEEDCSLV